MKKINLKNSELILEKRIKEIKEKVKLKRLDIFVLLFSIFAFFIFLYFYLNFYFNLTISIVFKIIFIILIFLFLKGTFGLLTYVTKNSFQATKNKNILLVNSIIKTFLSIYFLFIVLLIIFGSKEALALKLSSILTALGIFSALIIFAFQQPILSILGWFILIVKRYYNIGDVIEIPMGTEREVIIGQVLEIGLLSTKVRKLNKDFEALGSICTFPNSFVISKQIINYSFPTETIWDEVEIRFNLKEIKNIEKIEKILLKTLKSLKIKVKKARRIFELSSEFGPKINIRLDSESVIVTLRYLVDLNIKNEVKTKISKKIIEEIAKIF
jgi:small-conductance mechanosensitive channel